MLSLCKNAASSKQPRISLMYCRSSPPQAINNYCIGSEDYCASGKKFLNATDFITHIVECFRNYEYEPTRYCGDDFITKYAGSTWVVSFSQEFFTDQCVHLTLWNRCICSTCFFRLY